MDYTNAEIIDIFTHITPPEKTPAALESSGLSDADMKKIVSCNARKILHLD